MGFTATMTPGEIDLVLEEHFTAEGSQDIEAVLATLTDDVRLEVVGTPVVAVGKAQAVPFYQRLWTELGTRSVTLVRRRHGSDFVVDEAVVATDGGRRLFGLPDGDVDAFRVLFVFDLRDGLISGMSAWVDPSPLLAT